MHDDLKNGSIDLKENMNQFIYNNMKDKILVFRRLLCVMKKLSY